MSKDYVFRLDPCITGRTPLVRRGQPAGGLIDRDPPRSRPDDGPRGHRQASGGDRDLRRRDVFVASDDAGYISGAEIMVDGAMIC